MYILHAIPVSWLHMVYHIKYIQQCYMGLYLPIKINKVIKIFYNSEMPQTAIQNMQNVKN